MDQLVKKKIVFFIIMIIKLKSTLKNQSLMTLLFHGSIENKTKLILISCGKLSSYCRELIDASLFKRQKSNDKELTFLKRA